MLLIWIRLSKAGKVNRMGPYDRYRRTGVPWLCSVPGHWELIRGKSVLLPVDQRSTTGSEELLTVSARHGVIPRSAANVTMFRAESYVGYKLCWPGDLVVNSLWAWAQGLGVSRHFGIVSSAYGVYRPLKGADPSYIHLLVRSIPFQWELQVRSKGIWISRLQLTDEAFLRAPLLLPPVDEQLAIVRYLNNVEKQVRRYVRAKERLIGLLEEEKQAIVNQAVTRGLDPSVRMKASGVEWLGEVPKHWEVRRLKSICAMKSGDGITAESIESKGEFPVYGGNGIRGYSTDFTHDGEFALIGRQGALCGNVHIARGQFWASEHAVVASLRPGHSIDWFGSILQVMNLNQYSISAAQPGLAVERILSLSLPVPPVCEQHRIAAHLVEVVAEIDVGIVRARRQIELIEEYRTRLIADVVTGKLDVREAAAGLPETDSRNDLEQE